MQVVYLIFLFFLCSSCSIKNTKHDEYSIGDTLKFKKENNTYIIEGSPKNGAGHSRTYTDVFRIGEILHEANSKEPRQYEPSTEKLVSMLRKAQRDTAVLLNCRDTLEAFTLLWTEYKKELGIVEVDSFITHYDLRLSMADSTLRKRSIEARETIKFTMYYVDKYFYSYRESTFANYLSSYHKKVPFTTFDVSNKHNYSFYLDMPSLRSDEFVIKYGFKNFLQQIRQDYGIYYDILDVTTTEKIRFVYIPKQAIETFIDCEEEKYSLSFSDHSSIKKNTDLFDFKRTRLPNAQFFNRLIMHNYEPSSLASAIASRLHGVHEINICEFYNLPEHNINIDLYLQPLNDLDLPGALQYLEEEYGIYVRKL